MTWVSDLTHFLDATGRIPRDLPSPGRRMGEFLASIVAATTDASPNATVIRQVRCRRRPRRRPCPGIIRHRLLSDTRIHWECPSCGDNGFISSWQGTAWDRGPRHLH